MIAPRYGIDGPTVTCSFQSSWCKDRAFLAGGGDEHHEWPKSLGGSDDDNVDGQHLLALCPTHHRRQHAIVRAYVQLMQGGAGIASLSSYRFVRRFAPVELSTAIYAVTQWDAAGKVVKHLVCRYRTVFPLVGVDVSAHFDLLVDPKATVPKLVTRLVPDVTPR